jgi:hypothetical protein
MDDSSSFDLSAQNSAMSTVGSMNQAIRDHNDRIKNTFEQKFKIDEAGHQMKEYLTAGHDLSEGIGALKATGEVKKTFGEARKVAGPEGSAIKTYLSPSFQKQQANKNIAEIQKKLSTYLSDGETPPASAAASDDAVGRAAKGVSSAGGVAEQGVSSAAADVDPEVLANRAVAKASGLAETSPGSGVWKIAPGTEPATPSATITKVGTGISDETGAELMGERVVPAESELPSTSTLQALDEPELESTSTFKTVNPFDTISSTSVGGDVDTSDALAEAQQRARGILDAATGPTPQVPPPPTGREPTAGTEESGAGRDVSEAVDETGEVASDIKDVVPATERLAGEVGAGLSKLKAGAGLAGTAVGAASALYSAGRDVFDKGYFDSLNTQQKEGNIAGVVAGGLDVLSVAVPFLAPLAIGASIFSAIEDTLGEHTKGDPALAKDTEAEKEQTETEKGTQVASLSSQGLIASAPVDVMKQVTGTSSF